MAIYSLYLIYFCSQKGLHLYGSMSRRWATNTNFSVPCLYAHRWKDSGYREVLQWEKENPARTHSIISLLFSRPDLLFGLLCLAQMFSLSCSLDFYLPKTWRVFFFPEREVRSYLFVRFVSSIVTSRIFTKCILLLYSSYKWSKGWEGDHWVTCFFLNYLHKNRQRFHKKNEGIILFENKKCKQ